MKECFLGFKRLPAFGKEPVDMILTGVDRVHVVFWMTLVVGATCEEHAYDGRLRQVLEQLGGHVPQEG